LREIKTIRGGINFELKKSELKERWRFKQVQKIILLVDDNEIVRITLKEFLTLLGLVVIEASNGKEGLEKALSSEFHILITDYKMPDMTGIEMLEEILKFKQNFKVVILTGFANEIDSEVIKKLGVVAVLEKPVALGVLEKLITQLLANSNHNNHNNKEG